MEKDLNGWARGLFFIPEPKLRSYVLNLNLKPNHSKAELFLKFGYTQEDAGILAKKLLSQITINKLVPGAVDVYGEKYECGLYIQTGPKYVGTSRKIFLITGWIRIFGEHKFRLTTCYITDPIKYAARKRKL